MKDEELAEQYAQNLEKELMKEYEEHLEYGQTPYLATIPTPHAKQAFLAGLEVRNNQLTKAKYLLKYVLNSFVGDLPKNLGYFDEEELKAIAVAEQFLKEKE